MKKVLAILLVAALMVSSSVAVMAAGVTQDLATNVELTVKPDASGTYGSDVEIKTGETVALRATVDMSNVRSKFTEAMDLADAYCDGYYTGSVQNTNAKKEVRNAVVDGTFELVLTYPSAVKLPNSVVNGTALAGFSSNASNIFTEVSRTVKIGDTNSTLTIKVKIKNGLNLGTLEKNLNTYLADMNFTASGLAIAQANTYTMSGQLTGTATSDYAGVGAIPGGTINFVKGNAAQVSVTATVGTYTVSGTVANGANATVTLQGTAFTATADANGEFTISGVPNGQYNLVVTDGDKKTVTIKVEVKGADLNNVEATLPTQNISTIVTTDSETAGSVTGTADETTDAIIDNGTVTDDTTGSEVDVEEELNNGGSAEVKITFSDILAKITQIVDDIKEEVKDKIDEVKDNIKVDPLAGVKTEVVVKDGDGNTKATETKTEVKDGNDNKKTMHFSFPVSTSKKSSFAVVSADAGNSDISKTYTQVSDPSLATAGTFYVDELNDEIHVFTEEATADFAIAYVEQDEIVTNNPNQNEQAPNDNQESTATVPGSSGIGGYYVPSNDDDTTTITSWPFTDVNAGDWFYQGVAYAYSNGLFKGATATTFEPETALTRGMLVTVLGRYDGVSDTSAFTNTFADVADGEYYAAHIAWAADNKIVTGYGDGNFGPNDIITREQMATIMYRYMQYKGLAKDEDLSAALTYADASAIADYAVDGVKYCYLKGIMSGKEGNTFDPIGSATRAEFATVMMRTFQ